jgi:hypothetical protein
MNLNYPFNRICILYEFDIVILFDFQCLYIFLKYLQCVCIPTKNSCLTFDAFPMVEIIATMENSSMHSFRRLYYDDFFHRRLISKIMSGRLYCDNIFHRSTDAL